MLTNTPADRAARIARTSGTWGLPLVSSNVPSRSTARSFADKGRILNMTAGRTPSGGKKDTGPDRRHLPRDGKAHFRRNTRPREMHFPRLVGALAPLVLA